MSNSIIASNIPPTVTKDKVQEFFAFCGKIDNIEESTADHSFKVTFLSPSAVSTALLLNGAELGGSPVTVSSPATGTATSETVPPPDYTAKSDESAASGSGSDTPHGDIDQESKPKATIFAEYLSQGYVLGDHLVQKAVEHDKKNGYSEKFKRFLSDLDAKYDLQAKQQGLQSKQQELDSKYNVSSNLSKYFDKAIKTDVGSKLHSFYTNVVNDTKQVHEEAKRLAELKKQSSAGATPTPTSAASGTAATTTESYPADVKNAS